MPESAIAPAPTTAPSPAQAPPPSPSPAPQTEPLNDAFSDLDEMMKEPEPEKQPTEPKKDEPPKTEPKAEDQPPEKMAPKQLRQAYEALKAKHASLESDHETLRKTASQPKDDPEKKEFAERAERYSKKAQDLENELKFAKYEKSDEYQEKYFKPYEQAFGMGRAKAAGIKVTDAEGNPRQGTPEDFDTYMFIQDDEAAADFAEKVFGKHKNTMEYHREEVRKLGARSQSAIADYRKKGSDREKEWQENQSKASKAAGEYWQTLNKEALDKYPALFKAETEDAKGQELLTKGFALADRAFTNGAPLKDGDKPLNAAELMKIRSAMRNKSAAFDFQVHLKQKAIARVKALENELAEYKKSEPKGGDGKGTTVAEESWESQLEATAV